MPSLKAAISRDQWLERDAIAKAKAELCGRCPRRRQRGPPSKPAAKK